MINKTKVKKGLKVLTKEGPIELLNKIKNQKQIVYSPTDMLSEISFKIGYLDIILEKGISSEELIKKLKFLKEKYLLFAFEEEKGCQLINSYTFNNVFSYRSFIYIYKKEKCAFSFCFNLKLEDNLIEKINQLLSSLDGLKLLANYNENNNVSVRTSTFFNYEGTNYYSGGGERYLVDLHKICEELNLNLNIYQHGTIPFFRKFRNINVIGLVSKLPIGYDYQFIDNQSKNYIFHTFNNTKLHIYSAFQECYPNHIGPSIGISHGVSWDSPINKYTYGKDFFWENKKRYLDGAAYCNKLISVDTNTANWFQTVDYELGNQKFHVIPNYVDTKEFSPRKDFLKTNNKIVITYPRRLYEPRGLYLVLDIVDEILNQFDNVEFHFVGKGFDEDIKKINEKIKKYPNRIKCYSKEPERMNEVYKYSDISLIPTLYSEGTSLSCLEAMASGNLVVATRIGGLTDLIINEFNGYLIEPSSHFLLNILIDILKNFDKKSTLRLNAIETAKSFNKEMWSEKWKNEIREFKIQEQSNNNELIEIYINNCNIISSSVLTIIKNNLAMGNLIYLRTKCKIDEKISHGLLQIVAPDEEIVSIASKVYKEKNYSQKINRSEKIEKV